MAQAPPLLLINYFNYFTEIEEHFQRARATSLFLLSPLDWALIETWRTSGIPLEAVLRGIDAAFEKHRTRKHKTQRINSLAFCAQAVLTEAQLVESQQAGASGKPAESAASPFPPDVVRAYLITNAQTLRGKADPDFHALATRLEELAEKPSADLELLEQELSVLEQRLLAVARAKLSDADALEAKRDLDAQLRPYRGKMTAPQLAMLEQQYFERKILESGNLPRLSLFYLR